MKMCSKCGKRPQQKGSTGTWCNECANEYRRNRPTEQRVIRSRAYDPFDRGHVEVSPERRLWASVLTANLRDASGDDKTRERRQAKAWIGTADFREVCHLAGFDPEFVKDAYDRGAFTAENWKRYAVAEERVVGEELV